MTDNTKLPLTSADLTDALLTQLRDAAPQTFSEGRVDFTKLQAALGEHIETGAERYGLNWAGKREAFRNVQIPSVAALRPQLEESVNWDSTENLIIEGDNLEVLKLLQKPYHAKVKMIYIDPPYNTGNEFIYPDNFREGLDEYLRYTGQLSSDNTATSTNKDTSGRYHSNWLNMMYPRLFLARNLLREDGVIFVSIDDHEEHNLRLLMDEVFGEENFKGQITRATGTPTGQGTNSLVNEKDYILVYSKSPEADFAGLPFGIEDEKKYDQEDKDGRYLTRSLRKTGGEDRRQDRPSMYYAVIAPDGTEVYPIGPNGYESRWRCSSSTYETLLATNLIEWKKIKEGDKVSWKPYQKFYLDGRTKQPSNLWTEIDGNKKATREVSGLFGDKVFDFPKPVELIKACCQISTEPDSLIVDFFAGSGTTAHAVLDLNQLDHGNRRFILVQLPEKTDNPQYPTIAHITRERVRRVIAKLKENESSKLALEEKQDLGFRAFKLDSSNFKIWQADAAPQSAEQLAEQLKLYADNVQAGRGEQDRLYELVLKSGFPLSVKIETVTASLKPAFSVADGILLICLADHLDQKTLRALFARKPQMVLCLDTAFDGNDALKTNTVLEAQTHKIMFKTV
jgi:adenine-specific DNA-methyltransferase